jgi:hypothetical protein
MIEKIRELDGHTSYRDPETDSRFSRILAGLSFPASKPGFIVVIGEDYFEDPHLKCRHLRSLAEAEESDTERLFKKSLDLRERYQVERIIGDTENEPMMALLYDFNKGLDGAVSLNLYDGAFPNDLRYHAQHIKGVTRFNNKTFHLGECNMLRGHLSSFTFEDVPQGRAIDYPAVIALGFVISYCKDHPKDPVKDRVKQIQQEEDFDPLRFGL